MYTSFFYVMYAPVRLVQPLWTSPWTSRPTRRHWETVGGRLGTRLMVTRTVATSLSRAHIQTTLTCLGGLLTWGQTWRSHTCKYRTGWKVSQD